jgi:hypothetical protein
MIGRKDCQTSPRISVRMSVGSSPDANAKMWENVPKVREKLGI